MGKRQAEDESHSLTRMAPAPGTPVGGERPPSSGAAAAAADAAMQPDDGDVPMDGGHTGAARMHCPVPGCVAAAHRGHAGWETFTGLRAHVDAHILGQIPGAVPAEWLRARNMVSCRECSHLISRRCNGGVHRTCLADRMAARPQPLSLPGACGDADLDAVLGSLPSLDEMFSAPVGTRDLISSALLPSAQKEFLRCIVQVLQHNTGDAWAAPEDWQTRLRASGVVWLGLSFSCFAKLAGCATWWSS